MNGGNAMSLPDSSICLCDAVGYSLRASCIDCLVDRIDMASVENHVFNLVAIERHEGCKSFVRVPTKLLEKLPLQWASTIVFQGG